MNYQAIRKVQSGAKPLATLLTFVAFAALCCGCKTPLPFHSGVSATDPVINNHATGNSQNSIATLNPNAARASVNSNFPAEAQQQARNPQAQNEPVATTNKSNIQQVAYNQNAAQVQIGDLPPEQDPPLAPIDSADASNSVLSNGQPNKIQPLPQTHASGCECDACDARAAAMPARIHRRGPRAYHTSPYPQSLPPSAYGSNYPRDPRDSPADESYYPEEDVTNLFRDSDAQWAPPGVAKPWPNDEYIFDGGDRERKVQVKANWDVDGIDQQDTVVHYDTKDGRTEVEESNRVAIYAPRFSSVRKIYGVALDHNTMRTSDMLARTALGRANEIGIASTVLQPVQPARDTGATTVNIFRDRTGGANLDNALAMEEIFDDQLMTHENFQIIRQGKFKYTEKLLLSQQIQAAFTWTLDQGVQVIIDDQAAVVSTDARSSGEIVKYEMPKGKPRVRIVKVASKSDAKIGEIVDFTIRFDNIGDQVVGNVTIIDNLTTRLEYVPDSAKCDIDAEFIQIENEGESLVLRWEVSKPLPVGKGGVIRFKCKVR
jgi:uncharacterized repeat protein (TIGR01451 family)